MPSTDLYAGLQDPCNALLNVGGSVTYYMVAWAAGVESRNSEHGGIRIHAQIFVIGEQSQRTLLYDGVVFTAAANHVLDCVHCVHAADRYLIVYFLDRDTAAGTYVLKARWVDVQAFDSALSWSAMSDITPDEAGIYDVKQIENVAGTSEYMLGWISVAGAAGTIIVRRVAGNDHTASVWSTSIAGVDVQERILAVHGDAAATANNGGVLIAYQDMDNDLIAHVLDHSDGTNVGAVTAVGGTTAEYGAAGICIGDNDGVNALLIASRFETLTPVLPPEDDYAHSTVARLIRITNSPAALNTSQLVYNVHMLSKPYSYEDGDGSRHAYCGLAYSTVWNDDPYAQQQGFICDMGLQHHAGGVNTVRPRPVCTFSNQNIDARNHGWSPEATARVSNGIGKRVNHLSNFCVGPTWLCDLRKARAVVWPTWGASRDIDGGFANGGTRVEPVNAQVRTIWHYLEDPWTANRTGNDTHLGQPTVNFHGFNPLTLHNNVEVQDELLIAGGTPHLYDGRQLVELGFPWKPEIIDAVASAAAGSIPAGQYRYTAVYEWRDAQGKLHRSGHGNIVPVVLGVADAIDLIIRTLTIGERGASWLYPTSPPVVIAIYRTTLTQPNIFRRVHAVSAAGFAVQDVPMNDPAAWAITVTDNVNNVQLQDAPPLNIIDGGNAEQYTELSPATPPAAHLVAQWQNRAWLAASENRELWYSKENLPTAASGRIAPEFHPSLRFLLDGIDGDLTGMHPMDNELILFTRDGIYSLAGAGPDTLGNGANYQLFTVHRSVGCIEPRSIVEVPQGLVFQSYNGIHLLDRGKSINFEDVGALPEDLIRTAGNVRAAVYLPDRHEVAFVINGAVTDSPLVAKWNFLMQQWSTARLEPPNTTAWLSSTASGCVWRANERDASLAVLCQGNLLVERGKDDATPYRDEDDTGAAEEIRFDIETGWIALAGIAGLKRVREIGVQTEIIGTPQLMYAEIDYDNDGTFSQASPELKQLGTANAYMRLRPRQQKMTAFRLRLYEPSGVAVAENRKIHGIVVHVGVKKGPRKVAGTQQG